jgi:hypothetical protein
MVINENKKRPNDLMPSKQDSVRSDANDWGNDSL